LRPLVANTKPPSPLHIPEAITNRPKAAKGGAAAEGHLANNTNTTITTRRTLKVKRNEDFIKKIDFRQTIKVSLNWYFKKVL